MIFLVSRNAVVMQCCVCVCVSYSYLVMPFVAQDLGHIMKRRRLSEKVIVYLFYQLLKGLKVWALSYFLCYGYSTVHYSKENIRTLFLCF